MSSNDVAISVRNLSKSYTIQHNGLKRPTFREVVVDKMKHPFRKPETETFWALNDVSFEIKKGEVVGIVGRNGAGKSTLLKVLSRIVEPTRGGVDLFGRVGSLLEVGTGFHPELTGRENIYLNGAILGMRREEIRKQFDAIVDFAEVEKFLDTPVKRYSSGMYVRLAFAVAAHLNPEILIVDEVLAVGDAQFQKKCLGKMQDVATGGRTILFVSHNMVAIQQLCNIGIYLSGGRLHTQGAINKCISSYISESESVGLNWSRKEPTSAALQFESVSAELVGSQPHHSLKLQVKLRSAAAHRPAFVAVDISEPNGGSIMQAIPTLETFIDSNNSTHDYTLMINLPPLIPEHYTASLWTGPHNAETYDFVEHCVSFEITESPTTGRTFPHTKDHGFIVPHCAVV